MPVSYLIFSFFLRFPCLLYVQYDGSEKSVQPRRTVPQKKRGMKIRGNNGSALHPSVNALPDLVDDGFKGKIDRSQRDRVERTLLSVDADDGQFPEGMPAGENGIDGNASEFIGKGDEKLRTFAFGHLENLPDECGDVGKPGGFAVSGKRDIFLFEHLRDLKRADADRVAPSYIAQVRGSAYAVARDEFAERIRNIGFADSDISAVCNGKRIVPAENERNSVCGESLEEIAVEISAGDRDEGVDPAREEHFELAAFERGIEIVVFDERHESVLHAPFGNGASEHPAELNVDGVEEHADITASPGDKHARGVVRDVPELRDDLLNGLPLFFADPDIGARIPVERRINGCTGDPRAIGHHADGDASPRHIGRSFFLSVFSHIARIISCYI